MINFFVLSASELPFEESSRFDFQTNIITSLYARKFKSFPLNEKVSKIIIDVVPHQITSLVVNQLGVIIVQIEGDPWILLRSERQLKFTLSLEWLMAGVRKLAGLKKWPLAPFEEAGAAVVAANYENVWNWKRPVYNKAKSISAQVVLEHDIDEVFIFVTFKTKKGQSVGKVLLCSQLPSEFIYLAHLGVLQWLDEETVELRSKIPEEHWRARVPR